MDNEEQAFSPSAYMKQRRPHLFSDSEEREDPPISRDQFEYHLETLTNRQEETPFERFGRDLVKKEICPNLIPHTGPTGGGDGKTDSETYPVSEEIAALWWVGDPKRASNERFAFCFSTKKEWKSKFKADVESAVSTERNFTVIYFMTNQYVSSRERSALQDEYRKKFNCDIKILDRTWILDAVFDHKHWDLVTKHFDFEKRFVKVDGPQDSQRRRELEDLEKDLAGAEVQGVEFAEDCFTAALLARSLNMPRHQLDGMFERAERASEKAGNTVQLFRFVYRRAWTTYFWFDDFEEMSRLYEKAEPLVIANESSFILEDLGNLCQIGITAIREERYACKRPLWIERTKRLTEALSKISQTVPGTVNALWAQTQIHMMGLALGEGSDQSITNFSTAIQGMLSEASRHADYPMQVLQGLVNEFGDYIVDNESFDNLFEALMEIGEKRTSEAIRGKQRLRRGTQFLEHGKWYQAIDQLAKSQPLLAKEEEHNSYVVSVFLTGLAYRDAGLYWAARANMAVAISIAMQKKLKFGHLVQPQIVRMMQEFVLTELSLGRMFCALQMLEMTVMIASQIKLPAPLEDNLGIIDFVIARQIIETKIAELNKLVQMPHYLYALAPLSCGTLWFLLGYEKEAAQLLEVPNFEKIAEGIISETDRAIEHDFVPEWYLNSEHILRSTLLGCAIEVRTKDQGGILIGESLLAFIENFLATAVMLERCMATCPKVSVTIKHQAGNGFEVTQHENDAGEIVISINYSFEEIRNFADPKTYGKELYKALIPITSQMRLSFSEECLVKLFAEHEVMTRAQFGASSFTSILKLFGSEPKYMVSAWTSELPADIESYEAKRSVAWSKQCQGRQSNTKKRTRPAPDGSSKITDIETLRQTELSVQSPINFPVWKKAQWTGTAFGTIEGDLSRIEFWLTFANMNEARKVFKGWREKVGAVDSEEWLGIWIITGIDKNNPAWYRVVISINEDYINRLGKSNGLMVMSPTYLDMTPTNSANLDRFLKAYEQAGWYDLGAAQVVAGVGLETVMDLMIRKKSLTVVPAWQIAPSSVLAMAVHGIENPVIPAGMTTAPIHKALDKYRALATEAR